MLLFQLGMKIRNKYLLVFSRSVEVGVQSGASGVILRIFYGEYGIGPIN
jgi:hypothetical protein